MSQLHKILSLLLSCILLLSCNNNTDRNVIDKLNAKKTTTIFPFSEATKIEIVSFKSQYDVGNSFALILEDNLNSPHKLTNILSSNKNNIKERINLNDEQRNELFEILYVDKCGDEILGNCFTPRHAIIFYNNKNIPIAFSSISFECNTATISKNFTKYKLCEIKIKSLKKFFNTTGISYFEEPII